MLLLAAFVPLARALVAGIALLAPGYLLWVAVARELRLPRLATPAIMIGLSLSVIPLIFLWGNTLGMALSPLVLRLLLLSGVLAAGWVFWRRPAHGRTAPWLVGGIIFVGGLTLALRLYQIRNVALPLWVDSVHHALLIRIIGETGRYPGSLQPYVDVDQIAYHWGYHVMAATWLAATGLQLPAFMLLSGQVLNALHVLTIYALGAYLLRSPLAGIFAALATGLLSMMPAYYVTWGRYTQLTGLLLLPAAIMLSCRVVEARRRSLPLIVCAAIALAGLILVHYRVLVFYGAFMAAYVSLFVLSHPRRILSVAGRLASVAALSAALVTPWAMALLRQVLLPAARRPESLLSGGGYNAVDWSLVWTTNSQALLVAAGVGLLFALVRRHWRVLAIGLWVGILLLIANPEVIGLRPLWLINNHSVVITLFMPVSLLAGYGARQALGVFEHLSPRRLRRPLRRLELAAFALLGCFGAWQFRDVVNPGTDLAAPADLPALAWAAARTPPDARFLINATPWIEGAYRGTDAGWWLTPLAGRWTSTPPALYAYGSKDYVAAINQRSAAIANLQPGDTQRLDDLIRANHITHVFIGASGGPLKPEMFWGRPEFKVVYDRDGVLIFAVGQP
jgi:hypothetical protein